MICVLHFTQQIDSLNTERDYLKKQLNSLKSAAQPRKEEVARLAELQKIIFTEEKEIAQLTHGSQKLKDKVHELQLFCSLSACLTILVTVF